MCGRLITRDSTHIIGGPCGVKRKMTKKSFLAAGDCSTRAANATWWNWKYGSRPYVWIWSEEYCQHIWYGIPLWYQGDPPRNFASQRKENAPEVRNSMGMTLMMVFARRYLVYVLILSLTSFFSVPKGETDTWMVYNGTSSGMNAYLLAPWFALPTIYALVAQD
jgi:hypothetical protein